MLQRLGIAFAREIDGVAVYVLMTGQRLNGLQGLDSGVIKAEPGKSLAESVRERLAKILQDRLERYPRLGLGHPVIMPLDEQAGIELFRAAVASVHLRDDSGRKFMTWASIVTNDWLVDPHVQQNYKLLFRDAPDPWLATECLVGRVEAMAEMGGAEVSETGWISRDRWTEVLVAEMCAQLEAEQDAPMARKEELVYRTMDTMIDLG